MPHNTRAEMRTQAKEMREAGEQVILLIGTNAPGSVRQPSTTTPFNIVDANTAPIQTEALRIVMYAKVKTKESTKDTEGGTSSITQAVIESSSEWMPQMQQCYGVILEDGFEYEKTGEFLSETRSVFTILVTVKAGQGL